MEIQNQNTLEKHLSSGINIFTGAGFSVLAENQGKPLPIGNGLRDEILNKFKGYPKALELPQLCTLISSTKSRELDSFLRKRFSVNNFDASYENLHNVEVKNIFTTNIDNLIQRIYDKSSEKFINDVNFNGASVTDKNAIDLYYMHGSVIDESSKLIFSDLDISSAFTSDPARWNHLKNTMARYPTIFWGYALRDAGTLQVLSQALSETTNKKCWIVVHPEFTQQGEIEYYQSLGFDIIKADTKDFLDYLGSIATQKNNVAGIVSACQKTHEL